MGRVTDQPLADRLTDLAEAIRDLEQSDTLAAWEQRILQVEHQLPLVTKLFELRAQLVKTSGFWQSVKQEAEQMIAARSVAQ